MMQQLVQKKVRAAVTGCKYGLVTGLVLAVVEIGIIGSTSIRVPFVFFFFLALGDVFLFGILGTAMGICLRFKPGQGVSCLPFLFVLVFVYGLSMIFRSSIPYVGETLTRKALFGVVWLLFCILAGLIIHKRYPLETRGSTDILFVTFPLITALSVVGGAFINKRYFPEFCSLNSVLGNALIFGSFWSISVGSYKLLMKSRTIQRNRGWLGLPVFVFIALFSMILALMSPATILDSRPIVRHREGRNNWNNRMPSLILITLDTVRADHLSCYGYDRSTTPNIDAFAEDCIFYSHAVSTSPWTLPAHASLFTGMLPSEHGAHAHEASEQGITTETTDRVFNLSPARPLPDSATTLAEVLADNGYNCGAIVANCAYLWSVFQLDQGFHYYDESRGTYIAHEPLIDLRGLPLVGKRLEYRFLWYRDAGDVTDRCIKWLEKNAEHPFFLFVNYMDAHWPYEPPPDFRGLFLDESSKLTLTPELLDGVFKDEVLLPPEVRASLVGRYDEELAYLDTEIGRLFSWLREKGIYDNTLIVITSDHGESFGEHAYLFHKNCLYEQEIWVPLLFKYPQSSERNRVISSTISLAEIPNEALQILSLPRLKDFLWPMAELFVQKEQVLRFGERFDVSYKAIYEGNIKYIYSSEGTLEAYDLLADPYEDYDLPGLHKQGIEIFRTKNEHLQNIVREQRLSDPSSLTEKNEILQRLRAVGYLN